MKSLSKSIGLPLCPSSVVLKRSIIYDSIFLPGLQRISGGLETTCHFDQAETSNTDCIDVGDKMCWSQFQDVGVGFGNR